LPQRGWGRITSARAGRFVVWYKQSQAMWLMWRGHFLPDVNVPKSDLDPRKNFSMKNEYSFYPTVFEPNTK
jgi:hypothetical protein